MSDVSFDMTEQNSFKVHQKYAEPWKITLIDTGENTLTGGRLKRVSQYLGNGDFCFTYGDGVGNVDISSLLAFHHEKGCLATLTAAIPPGRFGALKIEDDQVQQFNEKPVGEGGQVNAGFFVLSPQVIQYITGDDIIWEREPLECLASEGQLAAYNHIGFWQPMDTLFDKNTLEKMWVTNTAPWKKWE